MDTRVAPAKSLFIASDSLREAELLQQLLGEEFPENSLLVEDAGDGSRLELGRHAVLVLAFSELERAERFYLSLYRSHALAATDWHRTIVLCSRKACPQAYEMCRRGLFDDYVLFWPMTHDPKRLLMSVHRAFADLARTSEDTELLSTFIAQSRQLADLDSMVSQELDKGREHIGSAAQALSLRKDSEPPQSVRVQAARESLQRLTDWVNEVGPALAPQLNSARALAELATRAQPVIFMVDDDEFQWRLVAHVLQAEGYCGKHAATAHAALDQLSQLTPDLILLDIHLPDLDGTEVLRRCKADRRLASIPIIMLTGHASADSVLHTRRLGASDFIVKPFDRATLISKVSGVLAKNSEESAEPA